MIRFARDPRITLSNIPGSPSRAGVDGNEPPLPWKEVRTCGRDAGANNSFIATYVSGGTGLHNASTPLLRAHEHTGATGADTCVAVYAG
ncbi:MAG TPA: hypothetical protein VFH51_20855, partial [Myxococcota bacterium]|nr:hypothetical protein [Myxococcota bacterium]